MTTSEYDPVFFTRTIQYGLWNGAKFVVSVDGFKIASDKCAYECKNCGAIFQSKNELYRSIFATNDPRCKTCKDGENIDLQRICECEPLDFGKLYGNAEGRTIIEK